MASGEARRTARLGVVGCGAIGRDHIRRLSTLVAGAEVTGVFDVVAEAAQAAVDDLGLGARRFGGVAELVSADEVDAIVIASRNDAHLEPLLAAIAAGKPAFVEKPMAIDAEQSRQVVEAEVAHGARLVQVGFNRRFDAGYLQMKRILDAGDLGAPLLGAGRHYNVAPATAYYGTENVVNDSFVHDIDAFRFLLDDDIARVEVRIGRRNSLNPAPALDEPQLLLMETVGGVIVPVEGNVNCQYGYDIQARVVCERGLVSLPDVATPEVRFAGRIAHPISSDWADRFADAYTAEFRAFVDAVNGRRALAGPDAWDGLMASLTADAALVSLRERVPVDVPRPARPALYA
ncbi:Gfo/Idh/MocA family oxidoreductase [Microbacterium sp. No. 7]|uniref:Gfo/Idh/MocA family oxidoreductase n=1 Tax=Microbacterium sp. No. 7 TaxID=1714373 RepID=UPI000A991136|nr:Gfo/Idh/MocA family oxidoreductase [Microbacterium sp. No. 7]